MSVPVQGQAAPSLTEDAAPAAGPDSRSQFEALCRKLLRTGAAGQRSLEQMIVSAMEAKDLTLGGEYAAIYAVLRLGTSWRAKGASLDQEPICAPQTFLSVPKLRHDIEQFGYLQQRGLFGEEVVGFVQAYRDLIDRLLAEGVQGRVPLMGEDAQAIGEVYGRLIHLRPTPRVQHALAQDWRGSEIEDAYLKQPPGLVVVDDFLSPPALSALRDFCLESTVWSDNEYAHGRLGSAFCDGFNNPLLLQIGEELRARLPRLIGQRYPLRQLWGFKCDHHQPADSNIHADFGAVNVNFWITPDDANRDPCSGGLIVYGVDAPLHWDFSTYNGRPDLIRSLLRATGAKATRIPYRQNRAIIFNSDLFHETEAVHFGPAYEDGRINITLLYGERENDVDHRQVGRIGPDVVLQGASAWRSPALTPARRARGG